MTVTDRQKLIGELERKFSPFTTALYHELQGQSFYFKEQKLAHALHLDAKLVTRHALPYCITEDTYFAANQADVQFFAGVILLHSLALTRIDNYYDGGNKSKASEPLTVDSLAYSLSATHEALGTLLSRAPDPHELAKLLNVTNFVHSRMYKDYTERYRPEYLLDAPKRLDWYLHSPRSRLLGSGYWEVMARASFVQRGKTFPTYLHSIDSKLRKFRQMIDELADVEEDVRGGLVTLPVLHALSCHKQPSVLRDAVLQEWRRGDIDAKTIIATSLRDCRTNNWIYHEAMAIYELAMKDIDEHLGKRGEGYRRLFDYKRMKLEQLC